MGNYGYPPGYWIGGLVMATILLVVAAPVALAVGLVWGGSIIYKACTAKEEGPATEPESNVENEASVNTKFRRHFDIGKAVVDVWFHPEEGVAKRVMRIRDEALAEQLHGKKHKLPDVAYSDTGDVEKIVEQTISEVQAKLGNVTMLSTSRNPSVKPVVKIDKRKAASAKTTHTGEVIRYGMEEKEGRDGPYRTFSLYIFDQDAGAEHEVGRGVDLERAIKEAGVIPGDTVKVESLGQTEVNLANGTTGKKNLWSVQIVRK